MWHCPGCGAAAVRREGVAEAGGARGESLPGPALAGRHSLRRSRTHAAYMQFQRSSSDMSAATMQ
jgi:hypothetical protein